MNKNLVESAVGTAFFYIEESGYVHGNIPEVAAALCFKIIKNHAFGDGNKRTAAASSIAFLTLNGLDLTYREDNLGTDFHRIIESVADNKASEIELKQWFIQHTHEN